MRLKRRTAWSGLALVIVAALVFGVAAAPAQRKAATLRIDSPREGRTVRTSEVAVKVKTTNRPKGAQLHFLLDGVSLTRTAKPQIKIAGLATGDHTATVELLSGDGSPAAPAVQATVRFRFEAPAKPSKVSKGAIRAPAASGGAAGAPSAAEQRPATASGVVRLSAVLRSINIITNAVVIATDAGAEVTLSLTPGSKLLLNGAQVSVGAFMVRTGARVSVEYNAANNTIVTLTLRE